MKNSIFLGVLLLRIKEYVCLKVHSNISCLLMVQGSMIKRNSALALVGQSLESEPADKAVDPTEYWARESANCRLHSPL